MKKQAIQYIVALFILTLASGGLMAQQTYPDQDLGLGYEPSEIVDEWNEWYTNPTPANAFIEDFMDDYSVPQQGQHGLNRKDTWYWWISHHETEIDDYIDRKDQNNANQ